MIECIECGSLIDAENPVNYDGPSLRIKCPECGTWQSPEAKG